MEQMCFSNFVDNSYTVGYKFWDMKVNIEKRAMEKSNPHLKIFTIPAKSKESGSQAVLNYMMASDMNKKRYCDPTIVIMSVENEDFEKSFEGYIGK